MCVCAILLNYNTNQCANLPKTSIIQLQLNNYSGCIIFFLEIFSVFKFKSPKIAVVAHLKHNKLIDFLNYNVSNLRRL